VKAVRALEQAGSAAENSFDIIYGLRTGSNAKHVRRGPGATPLVGGLDLDAYDRRVTPKHLTPPDGFARLVAKQRGRWKIGIQRIRTNSRTSWRRWLEAALVAPDETGLDSLTLLAERGDPAAGPGEALLCALGVLNSSLLNRWYRLGFTDVNVKPVYVARLPLPPPSAELANAVRRRLARPGDVALERVIDRLVAEAFGLGVDDVATLEEGFWGPELAARPLPNATDARAALRA
jgi:hypothetical protein